MLSRNNKGTIAELQANAIQLRLAPPRSNQRACINLANDFDFIGAVAQLGERVAGSHEVRGSSPLSSTFIRPADHDRRQPVLDVRGGGEELVLADDDPLAGLEVQRGNVAGLVQSRRDALGDLGREDGRCDGDLQTVSRPRASCLRPL